MRCTAKAKSTGEQCNRAAIAGGNVCTVHGGLAPQVKEAALIRQIETEELQACRDILRKHQIERAASAPWKDDIFWAEAAYDTKTLRAIADEMIRVAKTIRRKARQIEGKDW